MIPQQALYAKGPSKEIGLDLFTTYWKLPFYQSSDDYHIINTKLNLLYIFVADRINAFLALSLLRIAVLPSWKRLTGDRFFLHQIGLRIKAIWLTSYRIWLPMSLFWASRLLRLPLPISTIFISACKVIVRARQAV